PGEDGTPCVVLQFESQAALADDPSLAVLREVRLVLDAPQIAQQAQPYARLRELATALAQAMDGWIGDDQGQALDERALDAIGTEL
ncbi:UNVERIFIED_CONTAM: cell division protein FtsZ, partial [Salmonella enterica subsp. enterica serovar Weltevreden]